MDITSKGNASETPRLVTTAVPCNLCGDDSSTVLFCAKDRLHGCDGQFTYVKCRTCGLVYMNPQIREDYLSLVYPPDYSPHQSKADSKRVNRKRARSALRQMPFVTSLCHGLRRESRLLDVGCGSGLFLARIADMTRCEVHGVDSSQAAAEIARKSYNIDVFAGTITEVPFPHEHFDAVTSWWCLEHVTNPLQVLCKIHQLLKPGGQCIVGVPNIASFNARIFGDGWYHLDCPRHLYLYSPDTISRLLGKAGFTVEGIAHHKNTRGLVGSLRYCFGNDGIPLKYRKKPPGWRLIKALAHPWSTLLAGLRQSDLIVVRARKSHTPATRDLPRCNGGKCGTVDTH